MSSAEERAFIGGTHGKFVHICFTEEDGFISTQLFNYMSVINWNKVLQHFGSTGGTQAKSRNIIFNCAGNTCQRSNLFSCGNFSVYFSSLRQSVFFIQSNISIYFVFNFVNAFIKCIGKFNGANLFIYQFVM